MRAYNRQRISGCKSLLVKSVRLGGVGIETRELITWETEIQKLIRLKNRTEAIEVIKKAYQYGFRYVVRDLDSPYLSFYNYKPKKWRDLESWGYTNTDLLKPDCMPSILILKNEDIKEIKWTNQKPTLIKEFLEREENT